MPISDPGPRRQNNIWGDPNLGFVGNINGAMPNTGYGVYEQPIYDLASKYRSAKIITDGTLADLITELTNDNPIIVWGVIVGRTRDISWETPEENYYRSTGRTRSDLGWFYRYIRPAGIDDSFGSPLWRGKVKSEGFFEKLGAA